MCLRRYKGIERPTTFVSRRVGVYSFLKVDKKTDMVVFRERLEMCRPLKKN